MGKIIKYVKGPGMVRKPGETQRTDENKEFLDDLSGRLRNLPYDSQFKSQLKSHLISEIDNQKRKYQIEENEKFFRDKRLAELAQQKKDSSRANGGHNTQDYVGHYTNAWEDSGEGGAWTDENGNEHSPRLGCADTEKSERESREFRDSYRSAVIKDMDNTGDWSGN